MISRSSFIKRWGGFNGPALFVFLLAFVIVVASSLGFYFYVRNEDEKRLAVVSTQIKRRIESRLDRYRYALIQLRAHMATAHGVNRQDFKKYVESIGLPDAYPGSLGIGYALRIKASELAVHVRSMRSQGIQDYKVWPEQPREEYFAVVYLEPLDWRNQRAIGFDMYTEPNRRKAMEQARDTGLPAMTGVVRLVQETNEQPQPGFLIYVPVYRGDIVPSTLGSRQDAFVGTVYSPFRATDFFDAVFKTEMATVKDVQIDLFNGNDTGDASNHFYSNSALTGDGGIVESPKPIRLTLNEFGRDWTLEVRAKSSFLSTPSRFSGLGIFLFGTAISFLLYWIVAASRRHILQEAASMATLEKISVVSRSIAENLELEPLVQKITDIATSISKAQFGAFLYNVVNSSGESYMLYSLSGVPREAFSKFPMPRNTKIFGPTFAGQRTVRSNDITKDPNYGKSAPYYGMPKGHLPVRSYLAVPVISRSGEVLGGLFFGHQDVGVFTEREEQLIEGIASHASVAFDNARLYQRAQDAIKARDEFLTICSHELKTPITALKLQVQIKQREAARSEAPKLPTFLEFCNKLENQLNQLTRLVEDMLDVARIETGKLSLEMKVVDLGGLTKSVSESFAPQMKSAGIEIHSNVDTPLTVKGDADRLAQVVRNLISNALKYGNGKPISISGKKSGDRVIVEVSDQGLGIDEKDQNRIFKRFERAISHDNISGLGLGLFISAQIAEAHGGKIRVRSQLGQGSTFSLEVPIGAVNGHYIDS